MTMCFVVSKFCGYLLLIPFLSPLPCSDGVKQTVIPDVDVVADNRRQAHADFSGTPRSSFLLPIHSSFKSTWMLLTSAIRIIFKLYRSYSRKAWSQKMKHKMLFVSK